MKTQNPTPANTPSAIARIPFGHTDLPSWCLPQTGPVREAQPRPASQSSPRSGGMLLNDEIGREKKNPPWLVVERVLRELDPGRGNSYACLSVPGNTYVQCLRGFNGWHLEWRVTKPSGAYAHYRACRRGGSKKPFELKKHDHVSPGEHRDLLGLDEVLDAFRAFYRGQGLPDSLAWRKLDI